MRGSALGLALLCLGLAGCLRDTRPTRDRGAAGLFDSAPEVNGPKKDRCAALGQAAPRSGCDDAKYLGQIYVRKLAPGDEVCIEGGFGEPPGGACKARAMVVDAAPGKLLLEIRAAEPDSRWFNKLSNQMWVSEAALVDLYLSERGY